MTDGRRALRRADRAGGARGGRRRAARGGPDQPHRALHARGAVLAALGRADRAADLAAVVHAHGRARRAGDRGGRRRPRAHPPRGPAPALPRLDGEHPPVVHLAPAVVGPPAARSGTAATRPTSAWTRPTGPAGSATRTCSTPGSRAALWPFATLGWPDETAELKAFYPTDVLLDGARHPLPVGRPDGHDRARVRRRHPVRRRLRALDHPGARRAPDVEVARHRDRPAGPDRRRPAPARLHRGRRLPGLRRRRRPLRAAGDVLDAGRALQRGARSPQGRQLANKLFNASRLVLLRVPEGVDGARRRRRRRRPSRTAGSSRACRPPRPSVDRGDRRVRVPPRRARRCTTSSTASCATGTSRCSSRGCTPRTTPSVAEFALYVLARDARARAPDDPVRDRGDLVATCPAPTDLLMAPPLAGGRRRRCATSSAEAEVARAIEATQALRGWRDGVGAAPGARVPARLEAAGYERVPSTSRGSRASSSATTATSRWRPSACPAATSRCWRPTPSTSRPSASARAERARAAAQGDRARRGQARQPGLRRQGARGRRPGRARQARRGCRAELDELVMSVTLGPRPGRGAPALARAVRHALRAGAHAPAADRARLARRSASAPIHVVGTNGKSSTVRMTAALLEAHGLRTGAYLSPHLTTFAERIRIGDADLEPRRVRRRDRARRGGRGEGRPHAHGRRARHAVRAADRRRVRRARAPRGRGRGRRGGPRRALGRDQRARRAGRRAHQRRARAHALARADDRRHRGREARGRARRARRWCSATTQPEVEALAARDGRARSSAPAPRRRPHAPRLPARATSPPRAAAADARYLGARRSTPRARRRARPRTRHASPAACRSSADDAADDLRRRAQPVRASRRSPRRCPTRSATAAGRGARRSSTTRTRPAMLRALLPPRSRRRLHRARRTRARCRPPRSPSLAAQARRPARRDRARPARARGARPRARRSGRRRASRPARSTSSPTCSARPARGRASAL